MFSSRRSFARLAAVLLALASSAQAQVVIDFENLPLDTVITSQFPEVTFSQTFHLSNGWSVTWAL